MSKLFVRTFHCPFFLTSLGCGSGQADSTHLGRSVLGGQRLPLEIFSITAIEIINHLIKNICNIVREACLLRLVFMVIRI